MEQLNACTGREAALKAQHRHGAGVGGPGQDQLIGQIASQPELLEGIDHRVDVIHHDASGAHQPLQQLVARCALKVMDQR